jgi:hypothetical protein
MRLAADAVGAVPASPHPRAVVWRVPGESANREAPAEVRERPGAFLHRGDAVGGADTCHPTRWRLASGERAAVNGLPPAEAELNEPCATLGVVTREPGNARLVASFCLTRGWPP